jgi:pimeloyl-ACP methyl ester carboxylesterase
MAGETLAIDRESSTPRRRRRWVRGALLGLGALLLVLVAAGAIYQAVGAARDASLYPAPGRLVAVGDRRLHLACQGEGSPIVILETLSGGTSANWAWLQPEVAQHTRVCAYDRVGRGWSDPAPAQDLWATAETLHALLEGAGVEGPYVLVGHSIGGLYVRAFSQMYPEEVRAVVLVDASHPEQLDRHPEIRDPMYDVLVRTFPAMAYTGLFRLYLHTGNEIDFADLPDRAHAELVAFWSSPAYHRSVISEQRLAPTVYAQAHDLADLGDLPLRVVSAARQTPSGWSELQEELAGLSTNSRHVTIEGATHVSLALHPDHARQVSAVIIDLVEEVLQ